MVRRYGLRNGRRWIGVAGLSVAALSMTAAIFAPSGNLALVFLSCAYGGILFQQPTLCALCLDVGRKNAGAVFGFMNTAANAASALSAVIFGYVVGYFGNYNTPFIPMGEYWQATAYRKDLTGIIPGCFATFWGVRRA